MALTYEESAALMLDQPFRGRVKVACLHYAAYIQNEAPSVQGHSARYRWAARTYQMPDQVALEVQPPTVMDPVVQEQGSEITDAELQTAVEGVVNTLV